MQLIDEVIGYAKANSEAARSPDERLTWAAHHRNCVRILEAVKSLEHENDCMRPVLAAISQMQATIDKTECGIRLQEAARLAGNALAEAAR